MRYNVVSTSRNNLWRHDSDMLPRSWTHRADTMAVWHRTVVQIRSLSLSSSQPKDGVRGQPITSTLLHPLLVQVSDPDSSAVELKR